MHLIVGEFLDQDGAEEEMCRNVCMHALYVCYFQIIIIKKKMKKLYAVAGQLLRGHFDDRHGLRRERNGVIRVQVLQFRVYFSNEEKGVESD